MDVKTRRSSFIDILKGIFIVFVIVLHFPIDNTVRNNLLFPFWINMAVPCFMLISGYVSAISFQNRKIYSLEQAYRLRLLVEKLMRFMVPYTLAFIAEWIVFRIFKLYLVNVRTYGIFALFLDWLRGGKGQGSYYFPLMIQLVFLFPVIYIVIKKYDFKGLVFCFLTNAIFELLKIAYGMNEGEYRLLVFRYLFLIAAGCYLAVGECKLGRKNIAFSVGSMMVGFFFTYLFSYTNYSPKVLTYWSDTSFVACLFIVPVLGWLIGHIHWSFKPLEIIGKASFNIFLVQMIYYNFAEKMYTMIQGDGWRLTFNIVNCVTVGVIFYYLESKLTKSLLRIPIRKEKLQKN